MPKLTIKPSLDEVRELSKRGNLIPVYAELPTDLETPVSLFLKLSGTEPSFLLESVDGGERIARYSFLGVRMKEAFVMRDNQLFKHTLTSNGVQVEPVPIPPPKLNPIEAPRAGDMLDALRAEMAKYQFVPLPGLPRFCGGLVGYTGYDVVRQFEDLPNTAKDVLGVPDAVYMMTDTLCVFDHAKHRLLVIANAFIAPSPQGEGVGEGVVTAYEDAIARIKTIVARLNAPYLNLSPDPSAECTPTKSNKSQSEYEAAVRKAKEFIGSGDTFQVQVSRRLERRTTAHPFAIYRSLRMINPSPWMYYFNFDGLFSVKDKPLRIIGASPELHARYENNVATVRPIAGTRRRGLTEAEDAAMRAELLSDPKERAEHVMLIDLGRNDVGRIAKFGTVTVPELMVVENYSHVMHIVSEVQGEVRDGLDQFDVLRATFPAGTLTGAPKVRTMEIIEELEGERRGIYGGAVGYFSFNGQMDTCIVIRTIVMIGDTCYMQAAGGVVADSTPTGEYEETANKLRAVQVAIDEAEEKMIVVIDNYDSFTYNLVQYFGELMQNMGLDAEQNLRVFRNDKVTIDELRALPLTAIVISPGPGSPMKDSGISNDVLRAFSGQVPILGVCLGQQCMGFAFGGNVVRAPKLMHGKTSMVHHDGKGLFAGLPNPFEATRYHSLIVEEPLPEVLERTAYTEDGELMGVRHKTHPTFGVQFHPESILTSHGKQMIQNFLNMLN